MECQVSTSTCDMNDKHYVTKGLTKTQFRALILLFSCYCKINFVCAFHCRIRMINHILAYCTQPMDIAAHCNFVTFHWTNASGRWSFEGNFNSLIVITWELTRSLPFCMMPKCKLISWLHPQKMMKCEHLKHIHRLWIYITANYSIFWEK